MSLYLTDPGYSNDVKLGTIQSWARRTSSRYEDSMAVFSSVHLDDPDKGDIPDRFNDSDIFNNPEAPRAFRPFSQLRNVRQRW